MRRGKEAGRPSALMETVDRDVRALPVTSLRIANVHAQMLSAIDTALLDRDPRSRSTSTGINGDPLGRADARGRRHHRLHVSLRVRRDDHAAADDRRIELPHRAGALLDRRAELPVPRQHRGAARGVHGPCSRASTRSGYEAAAVRVEQRAPAAHPLGGAKRAPETVGIGQRPWRDRFRRRSTARCRVEQRKALQPRAEFDVAPQAVVFDRDEVARALADRALFVEGRPERRILFPAEAIDVVLDVGAVVSDDDERVLRKRRVQRDRVAVRLLAVGVVGGDRCARAYRSTARPTSGISASSA